MKIIISIMLALAMFCSPAAVFGAEMAVTDKITVTMNGETMEFDVEPAMEKDRVLVPFRAIFEALGCNVSYRENDGKQFVTAFRGDRQVILEIGKNEITIDGEAKKLDVAAKIENDRTLVPVRAVSEALGADVKWNGEINTAEVTTKQGDYKISSVTDEKTIKDDDGTVLMYINYVYPVIENKDNNKFIGKTNNEYKEYVDSFIKGAEEQINDAKELLGEMGKDAFRPFEFNLSYDVHTNKNGILSITYYGYYDLGGAHPSTTRQSRTFDMANEKELALSDVVNGNEDERHTMVYDVFIKYFEENYEGFSAETAKTIDEEADNVKFYLTDDSIVLYFDIYQVGPYAMQYPTVELSYSPGVFKLDRSADDAWGNASNGGN